MGPRPRALFEKVWDSHVVALEPGFPAVVYLDLHLIHEVTSPQAFAELRARGLAVRRPDRTLATMDHSVPTSPGGWGSIDPQAADQLSQLERNCDEFGIQLYRSGSPGQGIVHVIAAEQGWIRPGTMVACGDSHTSTHGALGALAFGIGTSEVGHVLASQCLLQDKPLTLEIRLDGRLAAGVTAKDLILFVISKIGVGGGTGHVIEYTGTAIRSLDIEARMTVCNMSIEAGARAGMIAPDELTFEYLAGRQFSPRGEAWEAALARWRRLPSEEGAAFDRSLAFDVSSLEPMITYGTNPAMGGPITKPIPNPEEISKPAERAALEKALHYMGLEPGKPLLGHKVDVVFIGSCTNARLSDLRAAASLVKGRKIAEGVRALVVPGSRAVMRDAEVEGLHRIFTEAGAEWRQPGCSMCIAMNGDQLQPGQYAVSTSNRNFEGRQGKGGRTFLASPLTAAAAAITGRVTDVRTLL